MQWRSVCRSLMLLKWTRHLKCRCCGICLTTIHYFQTEYDMRWCAYDINHIYELRIKNTYGESDIRNFWVAFHLRFQASPSAKPFIWKSVLFTSKFWFIYMWIQLISIWKALHQDSLWNRGERQLGNRQFEFNIEASDFFWAVKITSLIVYEIISLAFKWLFIVLWSAIQMHL